MVPVPTDGDVRLLGDKPGRTPSPWAADRCSGARALGSNPTSTAQWLRSSGK